MYAMMAPVEAGNVQACNVHFETPNLALPMIRELTEFEIDWVSGGAIQVDYGEVGHAIWVGFFGGLGGGIGGLAGSSLGPAGTIGGAAVGGAIGAGIGEASFQLIFG